MPYIHIRGANLHYLEAGNGPPIVCFHSTPASAAFYRPQLDYFGGRYRVLSFDLRGHGESDKPPGPYAIADFVADYVAIFEALRLDRFVLVGCSVGGIVAQLYALEHAANLSALVLIGSPCSRRGRDVAGFHAAVAAKGWESVVRDLVNKQLHPHTDPALKQWATAEYLKTPLYVRAAEEEALLAEVHHTERVQEITCPTLLVAGEAEEREIFEQMKLMSKRLPNAEWHVLPGAAHVPNLEKAREFNAIMARFLTKIGY